MGAQIAIVMVGSTLLNLTYFIIGLADSRISALARRRHGNYGFVVDAVRLISLVLLQLVFYLVSGLN